MKISDIVTHADPYHVRGASTGAIELITEQGWLQVYWQEDGDKQIHPAARTYEPDKLKLQKHAALHL